MDSHTRLQSKCPYITHGDMTTANNEELGTDHRHGMAITTGEHEIFDHDAGPLSQYWSTRSSNRLELVLTSKDLTWRG
jgi:hypothetical protein